MFCKQCNKDLKGKNEGAIFCSDKCRNRQFKRKKKVENQIKKIEKKLKENKEFCEFKVKQIEEQKQQFTGDLETATKKFEKAKRIYNRFLWVKNASYEDFSNDLFKRILAKKLKVSEEDFDAVKYGCKYEKENVAREYSRKYDDNHDRMKFKYFDSKDQLEEISKENSEEHWKEEEAKIEKTKQESEKLEKELEQLLKIDLENLPVQRNAEDESSSNKKEPVINLRGYTASELEGMKFETIDLNGELGKFIGKLQREKCAIALTGDSGAGKSTFSFKIAKAFLEKSLSVAYFSLEAGFTESMQELVIKLDLSKYNFKAFAEGRLKQVRMLATQYDCIFIDSYSKISSVAADFEALRQDFPNTFFVIIFQKTSEGKPRGGSSILYNSSATIDIQLTKENHRIAFMQKSRHNNENYVYSITQNKLLKGDKLPIKWSEIKEKWALPDRC